MLNLAEKIEVIEVDQKISGHPILIFKKRKCIPLNKDSDNKIIIDNKIVEENNLKLYNLINIKENTPNFIEPHKRIKTKSIECQPNNENNCINFEIIKNQNIELYKIQKQKQKNSKIYYIC